MENTSLIELDEDLSSAYVFVLDADGNLKSIMMPENYEEEPAPESVVQIMKMFNLKNLHLQTIH